MLERFSPAWISLQQEKAANHLRWSEEGLECSACTWVGHEGLAEESEVGEEILFGCPECGEECMHTPIDEQIDEPTFSEMLAALAASESANAELRAECERMRVEVIPSMLGQWASAEKNNTRRWMEWAANEMTRWAKETGAAFTVKHADGSFRIISPDPTKGAP